MEGIGLGWRLQHWEELSVVGHDGANMGQFAHLRLVPQRRFAVAFVSNSVRGEALWEQLAATLAQDVLGLHTRPSSRGKPHPHAVALETYAGRYSREGLELDLDVADGCLIATPRFTSRYVELSAALLGRDPADASFTLHPLANDRFRADDAAGLGSWPVFFLDFDGEGRPAYLHMFGRASRRCRT
jgi:hypothetical protein